MTQRRSILWLTLPVAAVLLLVLVELVLRWRGAALSLREPLPASVVGIGIALALVPVWRSMERALGSGTSAWIQRQPLSALTCVVLDTETTGLNPSGGDEVVSLAAVRVVNGELAGDQVFESLVNPGRAIPASSTRFHGITDDMVRDSPPLHLLLPRFAEFVGDAVLVGYNLAFDMRFLELKHDRSGVHFTNPELDVLWLSMLLHAHMSDHTLDVVAERLGVEVHNRHTALGDAMATAEVLVKMIPLLERRGLTSLHQILDESETLTGVRSHQSRY